VEGAQGLVQGIVRFAGEAVHGVDIDVADAGDGVLQFINRFLHGIVSVHAGQQLFVESLDTVAESGHAKLAQQTDLVRRKCTRRRFHGDFGVGVQGKVAADGLEDAHQQRIIEKARCAPPKYTDSQTWPASASR